MYGRMTTVSWGIIYPNGGSQPRHPSQLYEAFAEGILLFLILNWCWRRTNLRQKPGRISALFLIGYGFFRIIIEYFKEPESWIGALTIGQFLSLPLLGLGWYLLRRPIQNA
jgi:phosphatidylglycerol:prolipoprotein diacylglycerol transferase